MNKIRVALIGCGRAGLIHARNYLGQVPGGELAALCDPVENSLLAAQRELGINKGYTDYRELMADESIDAVIVATPTRFHHEMVIAAAKAHKHVFCEKPMAESTRECDEMIAACAENGVKLQLGFMRRFDRSFRRAKAQLESGAVGAVTMIRSNTYGPSEPKPWMFDVRTSYGPIGEVNSHDFDTLRWYAGSEAESVYAIGHNFRSQEVAEKYPEYYDTCQTLITFQNGVIGAIGGAQYVRYGYDARTEILGTEGIIKVGSQHAVQVETVTADRVCSTDSVPSWQTLFLDAYAAEDSAFIQCILDDTEPEVTGEDGKRALMLVYAGLKSILEKRPVALSEMEI